MVYRRMHFSFFIIFLFSLHFLTFAESPVDSLPESFPVKTVENITVSPDGKFILCSGSKLALYDFAGKELWYEDFPLGSYCLAAFTPSEIICALSGSREIQMRTLEGKQLPGFKTPQDIISLAVSRDGTMIAAGGKEYGLHLWDRKGNLILGFTGLTDWAGSLAISPDNKTLASGGSWWSKTEAEIILWAIDGSGRKVLDEKQKAGIHLEYSPMGDYLLSGSFQRNKLILWDTSGKEIQSYSRDLEFGNRFTFCGDYIISIKREDSYNVNPGVLQIWSIDGTFLDTIAFPGKDCASVAAIPGTSWIVIGQLYTADNPFILEFLDIGTYKHTLPHDKTGKIIFNTKDVIPSKIFEPQPPIIVKSGVPLDSFSSIAFSGDEKQMIMTGYNDGPKLQFWDLSGESIGTFTIKSSFIDNAIYAPSGQALLVLGEPLSLMSTKGESLTTFPADIPYMGGAFLAGDAIIAGSFERKNEEEIIGIVYLFDKEGRLIKELARTTDYFRGLSTNPPGDKFLCYGEKKVFLFQGDGTPLSTIKNESWEIRSSAFLGTREEILILYNPKSKDSIDATWCGIYDFTGKFLRRFKIADNGSSSSPAVSPDGNYIACRFFEAIKVFSPFGTLLEENLDSTQSMDWFIRFSPGGNYLVCNFPGEKGALPLKLWKVK
ncbi:MAG: hypothetical protein JXJ04_02845 [Spirochaetales bacterium]|nr:hypothetical protein [Spirochaetales bacterium]